MPFHLIKILLAKYAIMVLCEACSLKLVRVVEVPLITLFNNPALCIFRSARLLNKVINGKYSGHS